MANRAFLDTTILADVLLAKGERTREASAALKTFSLTLLPVYAIKEFKAGPLKHYAWTHNKLAETGSLRQTVEAISRFIGFRRTLPATALEALQSPGAWEDLLNEDLSKTYGAKALVDTTAADALRLALKTLIFRAWRRRRSVATEVVCPLTCYEEQALVERGGAILVDPTTCGAPPECSLAGDLKAVRRVGELRAMRDAIKGAGNRESDKRSRVLRQLIKKPKEPLAESGCRDLGDAVFAFFAPKDATIVTTNIRDHRPLAAALGKTALSPKEILAEKSK